MYIYNILWCIALTKSSISLSSCNLHAGKELMHRRNEVLKDNAKMWFRTENRTGLRTGMVFRTGFRTGLVLSIETGPEPEPVKFWKLEPDRNRDRQCQDRTWPGTGLRSLRCTGSGPAVPVIRNRRTGTGPMQDSVPLHHKKEAVMVKKKRTGFSIFQNVENWFQDQC